jgi:hypothetical protein
MRSFANTDFVSFFVLQTTIVALDEVLGGHLTQEHQQQLWAYLGIVLKPHIVTAFNYRQVRRNSGKERKKCSASTT